MENSQRLQHLLDRYFDKTLLADESAELLNYFSDPVFFTQIEERFGKEFERESGRFEMDEIHQQEVLKKVFDHEPINKQTSKKRRLWPRLVAAAAVLIIVCSIGLLYLSKQQYRSVNNTTLVNDVAPGKAGATLTLANGEKILINDALSGNIANQSGVKISKTKGGQIVYEILDQRSEEISYNTLTTSRGEQVNVRLPDGTVVFLNAATILKYPTSFTKMNKREVTIEGEGYFEVFKDKAHPFVVSTAKQQIEVLGTHFNINSYADEPATKTTLLEGSVKVNSNTHSEILKPNQQAVLIGNKITVRTVDTEETVAWKNNEFLFKDDDFRTNMRKIARWYNVEVIYEEDAPNSFKLGGFSSRSRSLKTILKLMEQTGKVHFRIEGKKVYVGHNQYQPR
jgi:transmembrane sensor